MPRLARNVLDEYRYFHVATRGVGECFIYADDLDRLGFADCFWNATLEYELKCLVACQVGTHYHALFDTEGGDLSAAMRKLNGTYARRFNCRHERRGHLFGDRFHTWIVEDESHLSSTIEYILWNPVRAGLCEFPDEWEWSWLSPEYANAVDPILSRSTGSDCPMGQSLRRVCERRRRAQLRAARGARQRKSPKGVGQYVDRDEL